MEDTSDTSSEATTSIKILNHFRDKNDFDPVRPSHLYCLDFYCLEYARDDIGFVLQRHSDVVTSASRFLSEAWSVLVDDDPLRQDTIGND